MPASISEGTISEAMPRSDFHLGEPPPEANPNDPAWRSFFETLRSAKLSALLLDFDGTLAPFRRDPATVRPYAGVTALLNQIQQTGRTRLALVSGRPAQNVATQLGLAQPPEVWGLHGAERLFPDGYIEHERLPLPRQLHLNAARKALEQAGWLQHPGIRLESKWNAVVLHWRGLAAPKAEAARDAIHALLQPIARDGDLEMLLFDGGIEMRAGRTKGDSVNLLLAEIGPDAPVAYLGDDTTDEFAFQAITNRTSTRLTQDSDMTVLVRRAWRPTAARLWLRPPVGLRSFLRSWLQAIKPR
jgi:trehalose-phosphatase